MSWNFDLLVALLQKLMHLNGFTKIESINGLFAFSIALFTANIYISKKERKVFNDLKRKEGAGLASLSDKKMIRAFVVNADICIFAWFAILAAFVLFAWAYF